MTWISDKKVLITGATDGIGEITAQKLVGQDAKVILHGRDPDKIRSTADAIQKETGTAIVATYVADLSELSQVRALADTVRSDHGRLHVLINNAGVLPAKSHGDERLLSEDGYELCFAVNYLAPFLLTHLLLPLLRDSAPARIVNVSSAAQDPLDFEDLMLETGYSAMRAYGQSKLALAMFTLELAERLDPGTITANCLHPGSLLDTKMVREAFTSPMGSAESGAEVEVYVAGSRDLAGVTGRYFNEKREARLHGQAYDPEARRRLWEISRKLTGLGEGEDTTVLPG